MKVLFIIVALLFTRISSAQNLGIGNVSPSEPAAGTYLIGCVIQCPVQGYLDNNDWVNLTYTVINE